MLLVDLDPQGHLTEACGVPETTPPATLAKTLPMDADKVAAEHVEQIITPWRERIDVVPTNIDMFLLERELYRMRGVEWRLERVLKVVEALGRFDVCLIDCQPSLGVLTDNALVAAGQGLVPVQLEDSALRALRRRLLLEQIATLQSEFRVQVDLVGMVVNLFDKRRGQIVTSTLDTLKRCRCRSWPSSRTWPPSGRRGGRACQWWSTRRTRLRPPHSANSPARSPAAMAASRPARPRR